MSTGVTTLSTPSLTPLPESLTFLDRRLVQVAIVATTVAIATLIASPFLITANAALEGVSLFKHLYDLPNFVQIAFSITMVAGGCFTSSSFAKGIGSWREFFRPGKIIAMLTIPLRSLFSTAGSATPILAKTVVTPMLASIFFGNIAPKIGRAITSKISSSGLRSVAERIQQMAIAIFYGIAASRGSAFVGVIQGIYAVCTYGPAAENHGFLGWAGAHMANETCMNFVSTLFGSIRALF